MIDWLKLRVSPAIVVVSFLTLYFLTVVAQFSIPFFPKSYSLERLPAGKRSPPFITPLVKEYLDKQQTKPWVLIGDSVAYGFGVSPRESFGFRLARKNEIINLSLPAVSLPQSAMLIQYISERYPQKKMISQVNMKWFTLSSFQAQQSTLRWEMAHALSGRGSTVYQTYFADYRSRIRWIRELNHAISLQLLRHKIQFRWIRGGLKEHLSALFSHSENQDDWLYPFIAIEIKDRNEKAKTNPKILATDNPAFLSLLQNMVSPDASDVMKKPEVRALMDSLVRAKPRIGVLITPVDPESLAMVSVEKRENFLRLVRLFEEELRRNGIPFEDVEWVETDFADLNHFSAAGHRKAEKAIERLRTRI